LKGGYNKNKMKKILSLLTMAILVFSIAPVMAVSTGDGITPTIGTEDFPPMVWQCGRWVADDAVEPQLYNSPRFNNYAFEGESISWNVLVLDKNGINKVTDVYATLGSVQGSDNPVEANCVLVQLGPQEIGACEAMIGEENVDPANFQNWNQVAAMYQCTLTVETPDSMYGEYWATIEAIDLDLETGTMAQNEYWFLNPVVALDIRGDLTFDNVRPGTVAYSETLLVGNDADIGSGVLLDMYISGTNFYDLDSSAAMCPTSNVLSLNAFSYDATNGQFAVPNMPIRSGDTIAQAGRIMDGSQFGQAGVNPTNFLAPGAEIGLTFQLALPEPCNGDFNSGDIFFWGEAI